MTLNLDDTVSGKRAPVLDEDPFSAENLENPYPFHARLREVGPIAFLPKYNVHAVGRYDEVHEVLSNWQQMVSGTGTSFHPAPEGVPQTILRTDPPEHDALREVLTSIMSARVLRSMADECRRKADGLIGELLDGHRAGDTVEVDGFKDIASVLPVDFFPDAAGITDVGRENLVPYADDHFNRVGPTNDLVIAGDARRDELEEWAGSVCERDSLKPKGFGADIWAATDRGDLLPENAPRLVRSLPKAGVDTTVYGLAALLYALATNPDQWNALRDNPNLARVAFDEAIRLESPVQMLFRKSAADVIISGVTIPTGARVLICYGAANRDPRRWRNPDKFDLSRDPSGHVAFGMGIHQCAGQHAARLEAAQLLAVLVERVERIELAGPVTWHPNNALRGWGSIPLRMELAHDR